MGCSGMGEKKGALEMGPRRDWARGSLDAEVMWAQSQHRITDDNDNETENTL